jgi:hypothetical protein
MDRIDPKESGDMERSPGKLLVNKHGNERIQSLVETESRNQVNPI